MAVLCWVTLLASLLITSSPAAAVGYCNTTVAENVLSSNNCPTNILSTLYSMGPELTYRVMPASRAALYKCATVTIGEVDKNLVTITNTYSFTDSSIANSVTSYNLADSLCGLAFKYDYDNSYEMYKVNFLTVNSLSAGYYECTNEEGYYIDGELLGLCLAPQVDSDEVTAAAEECRQAMIAATGATDLVLVPHCTNAAEDTSLLVEVAETVSEVFSTGGLVNLAEG